jgi:hypothetical protein
MIKLKRLRWVEHVLWVEEKRNKCKILVRNCEGK